MMTAPARLYRDPLEILEWAERNSCKGCAHKTRMLGMDVCEHPKRHSGKADRRCKYYDNGEDD